MPTTLPIVRSIPILRIKLMIRRKGTHDTAEQNDTTHWAQAEGDVSNLAAKYDKGNNHDKGNNIVEKIRVVE